MKKIVYVFIATIILTSASYAFADRVIIPVIAHYGLNDFSQVFVKNLADEVMQVDITFYDNVEGHITSTGFVAVAKTSNVPPGETYVIRTNQSDMWAGATVLRAGSVTVVSSNVNDPFVGPASADGTGVDSLGAGPIAVNAMFVHIDTTRGPSGFSYPVFHRSRTWVLSTGTLATPGTSTTRTIDNWEQ